MRDKVNRLEKAQLLINSDYSHLNENLGGLKRDVSEQENQLTKLGIKQRDGFKYGNSKLETGIDKI